MLYKTMKCGYVVVVVVIVVKTFAAATYTCELSLLCAVAVVHMYIVLTENGTLIFSSNTFNKGILVNVIFSRKLP